MTMPDRRTMPAEMIISRWIARDSWDHRRFDWPADRIVGRGYVPGRVPPMHDDTVVRVVLRWIPGSEPPYRVVTSYPKARIDP